LTEPTHAPGSDRRRDVSGPLWLSAPLGGLPRAGLGPAVALADAGGLAQTVLAQAATALGAGGVGTHLVSCGVQESSHAESVAVALGVG